MLSRTHLIFGFSILLGISFLSNIKITIISLFLAFIASLLPDIDERNSRFGRRIRLISLIFDHRGLLHTVWFAILFSILVYGITDKTQGIIFFALYSSHLFMDGLTKQGIKPFYPLGIAMKGNMVVGGFKETLFFYFLLFSLMISGIILFFNGTFLLSSIF